MKSDFEIFDDKIPSIFYPYYLGKRYKEITGNNLNLLFPKLLSEKIQWLKLFDSTKEKGLFSDKIAARDCFCRKISNGQQYLKPLLGIWNNFDEINFDKLPDKFILKLNHGCGFNSFVINKDKLLGNIPQFQSLRKRIILFQNTRYYLNSFELHYKYITPKILAEELIGGSNAPLFNDWMIYCFNGIPKFCNYIVRYKDGINYSYVYNENFEKQNFSIAYNTDNNNIIKAHNYEKMFEFARILSEDFKFVRVDFIEYERQLYFAEMTFTPYSGYFRFNGVNPDMPAATRVDRMLGNMLKL